MMIAPVMTTTRIIPPLARALANHGLPGVSTGVFLLPSAADGFFAGSCTAATNACSSLPGEPTAAGLLGIRAALNGEGSGEGAIVDWRRARLSKTKSRSDWT